MHCVHHPTCPGCPLLDLPYADQLVAKRDRLVQAVAPYPHLGLPPVPTVRAAPRTEGYRTRLKLPVDVRGRRVAIGLYDGATHAVLDTPTCPVLTP
ncbi:MAG: RNA methyltransferase, partial [Alphaproteobacteria bacterium]|nr:RNA methyltransferase [Alphaproteobacteria bacterium]